MTFPWDFGWSSNQSLPHVKVGEDDQRRGVLGLTQSGVIRSPTNGICRGQERLKQQTVGCERLVVLWFLVLHSSCVGMLQDHVWSVAYTCVTCCNYSCWKVFLFALLHMLRRVYLNDLTQPTRNCGALSHCLSKMLQYFAPLLQTTEKHCSDVLCGQKKCYLEVGIPFYNVARG